MRFYTDADLGPRQSTLPSGSLWCRDVTIARCGTQLYHPSEIGEDGDDMVMVQRDPDEVFAETAMASFEAAPVTLGHPVQSVDPSNWSRLAIGHVQNVRRDGDLLIGDLIIHDRRAIDAIRNRGWRAISCGYDASYQPIGGGRMKQVSIVGNHVAVLGPHEEARCGELCSIGDVAPKRRRPMKTVMQMTDQEFDGLLDKLRKRTRDQTRGNAEIPTTWRASRVDPNTGQRLDMGTDPDPLANGGALIISLPGEITSYYIGPGPNGFGAALYMHGTANGALRGVTTTADNVVQILRSKERAEQQRMGAIAQRSRDFWKAHANG